MSVRGLILLCVGGMFFATSVQAQSGPQQLLLALSKKDQTLAIVDPASLKVLARIPVGNDPHEVIASSDGKTAYVSNYGFGAYNTIAVIDLVEKKALPAIDLGPLRGPHGLAFVSGKTWFTAEAAKAIGSYDPKMGKVDWILGTGQDRTHMIWVAEDQKRILTTNVNSGSVSIIDKVPQRAAGPAAGTANNAPPRPTPPGGDWEQTVVKVGNGSEGFDVSPDGKEIWVANSQDGTISIITVASKNLTDTIAANVPGANRLKFTPDGARVLVSSLRTGDLTLFDSTTRKEIKRLKLGHGNAGILVQPDGERAFVACSPDNYVVVINLKSFEDVGHIDVGQNPDGLAWAARR
jgi:DNA-binding beta-propeller fold protein YncE